jgi:predicted acylesterase/phospholipase RssA
MTEAAGTHGYPELQPIDRQLCEIAPLPDDVRLVISLDGGGSRGVIPAFMLRAWRLDLRRNLSDHFDRDVDVPLRSCLDLVGGTSVGALIGAALVLEKELDVFERFPDIAGRIFSSKRMGSFFRKSMYRSRGRLEVIREIVGDKLMSELDLPFVVTFYSNNTAEAMVLESFDRHRQFLLSDALMMSSAAPTYFGPHHCTDTNGDHFSGCDGGLFANNPVLAAYIATLKKYRNDCSRVILVSVGTGVANRCSGNESCDNLGTIDWASRYPDVSIEATGDHVHRCMTYLAGNNPTLDYHRLTVALKQKDIATDNTKKRVFESITATVRAEIETGGRLNREFSEVSQILFLGALRYLRTIGITS